MLQLKIPSAATKPNKQIFRRKEETVMSAGTEKWRKSLELKREAKNRSPKVQDWGKEVFHVIIVNYVYMLLW